MKKIKDRIILGAISGIIASIPCTTSYIVLNKLGLIDNHYNYPSSMFLTCSKTRLNVAGLIFCPMYS